MPETFCAWLIRSAGSRVVEFGRFSVRKLKVFLMSIWFLLVDMSTPYLGGYSGGVPPLPIPNREVKPACADGTAMQCGRVGSRLFSSESPVVARLQGSFLFCGARRKLPWPSPESPTLTLPKRGGNGGWLAYEKVLIVIGYQDFGF